MDVRLVAYRRENKGNKDPNNLSEFDIYLK